MPLPDGTNAEREDPEPPVNWTSKADLNGAILYGAMDSPPCIKMLLTLLSNGVSHTMVKHQGGKPVKKGGSYKKVPVMVVGDRQINDSYIIIKNLAPAIYGSFDKEWEEKITFKFQPSLECEILGHIPDFTKCAVNAGYPKCIVCCVASRISSGIVGSLKKNYGSDLPPSVDIGKEFCSAMGEKPFFAGDSPGQIDVSYFATLVPFVDSKTEGATNNILNSGLKDWWNRMCDKMPVGEALRKPGLDLRLP